MPAHQALPLTGGIFKASYSTSAMEANKIYSVDQSELLKLWAGIGTLTYCIMVHGNLHLNVKFCI